jgi:hypothetical protein
MKTTVEKYRKLYERGIYSKDETAMYLAELLSCTQAEAMAKLFPPTPDFDPLMKAHVETVGERRSGRPDMVAGLDWKTMRARIDSLHAAHAAYTERTLTLDEAVDQLARETNWSLATSRTKLLAYNERVSVA